MEITIHSGQHRSCSNTENQCSSLLSHKYIFEDQAKNLPSMFVFHWFFQPTNSEGFHLKDKCEKCDICSIPHSLPAQAVPFLPKSFKRVRGGKERLISCSDIPNMATDGIALRRLLKKYFII